MPIAINAGVSLETHVNTKTMNMSITAVSPTSPANECRDSAVGCSTTTSATSAISSADLADGTKAV